MMHLHIERKPNNKAAIVRGYKGPGGYEEKAQFIFVATLFDQPDGTTQFCAALGAVQLGRRDHIALKAKLEEEGFSNVVMERHGRWVNF